MLEEGRTVAALHDQAFGEFYAADYQRFVRLGYLLTGSVAVAEELTQDAFSQLYPRWATVTSHRAWMRAAVVNGARMMWRRELRHVPGDVPPPQVDEADALAVRDALDALPARQRAAVVLRYFEAMTEREIADALGCAPGTVKSLIHRSMTRMKEALQ